MPITLLIIFLLLFLNFGSLTETLIVMLSLPFALVGGLWLMWYLGFNMSVAVAVGFVALAGVIRYVCLLRIARSQSSGRTTLL